MTIDGHPSWPTRAARANAASRRIRYGAARGVSLVGFALGNELDVAEQNVLFVEVHSVAGRSDEFMNRNVGMVIAAERSLTGVIATLTPLTFAHSLAESNFSRK